jgi:hypothetical protein
VKGPPVIGGLLHFVPRIVPNGFGLAVLVRKRIIGSSRAQSLTAKVISTFARFLRACIASWSKIAMMASARPAFPCASPAGHVVSSITDDWLSTCARRRLILAAMGIINDARWLIFAALSNKSDASGGSVFRIMTGPAKVGCNRRARSTPTLCSLVFRGSLR